LNFFMDFFAQFSSELIIYLLLFLDYEDLCRVSKVCKRFRCLANHDIVWIFKCEQRGFKLKYGSSISAMPKTAISKAMYQFRWKTFFKEKLFLESENAERNRMIGEKKRKESFENQETHSTKEEQATSGKIQRLEDSLPAADQRSPVSHIPYNNMNFKRQENGQSEEPNSFQSEASGKKSEFRSLFSLKKRIGSNAVHIPEEQQ